MERISLAYLPRSASTRAATYIDAAAVFRPMNIYIRVVIQNGCRLLTTNTITKKDKPMKPELWNYKTNQKQYLQNIYADMALIYDLWIKDACGYVILRRRYFNVLDIKPTCSRSMFNYLLKWFQTNGDPRDYTTWVERYPDWDLRYTPEIRSRMSHEFEHTTSNRKQELWQNGFNQLSYLQAIYSDLDMIYDLWREFKCGHVVLHRLYFDRKGMKPITSVSTFQTMLNWLREHDDPRKHPAWLRDFR